MSYLTSSESSIGTIGSDQVEERKSPRLAADGVRCQDCVAYRLGPSLMIKARHQCLIVEVLPAHKSTLSVAHGDVPKLSAGQRDGVPACATLTIPRCLGDPTETIRHQGSSVDHQSFHSASQLNLIDPVIFSSATTEHLVLPMSSLAFTVSASIHFITVQGSHEFHFHSHSRIMSSPRSQPARFDRSTL